MIRKVLCVLCVCFLTVSSIASAGQLNIMTHSKGIVCEENFDEYESELPVGFTHESTSHEGAKAKVNKAVGKDDTIALGLNNTNCEQVLAYNFDVADLKAIEISFDICLQDLNSEKAVYIKTGDDKKIKLISFTSENLIEIGNNEYVKSDFKATADKWYKAKVIYNLADGFTKAIICDDYSENTFTAYSGNASAISAVCFESEQPIENVQTEYCIDNLLIKGSDPVYPTPSAGLHGTDTFDDSSPFLDSTWLVQHHNADNSNTSDCGIFACDGKDGSGVSMITDGSMLELVKIFESDNSYCMSMSLYFSDMNASRAIAVKGYPSESETLSREIPLIIFRADGTAKVGQSDESTFNYEVEKWYDVKIYVNNVNGSINVMIDDGMKVLYCSGTMSVPLQTVVRTYMYNGAYDNKLKSEWRIDDFLIQEDCGYISSLQNGEEGVPVDIGEVIFEFNGNITEIGPVLINGSICDIKEITISSNIMKVKINKLVPEKEYVISFSGVKDGENSYRHGFIRFKTSSFIYISDIKYKNNAGSLAKPEPSGFSSYFKGRADENKEIIIISALYSSDGKELIELNMKKEVLGQYKKEYDIYMELPKNNENYIYKLFVWTGDLTPLDVNTPEVCERPSGSQVLSDIEKTIGKNNHPRLYVNSDELINIKQHINNDGILKDSWNSLLKEADVLISTEPCTYDISGGTLLNVSREIKSRVEKLGVAYVLSGEEKYAERLYNELYNAALFNDWNPHHFLDTAEMLSAFAIGYDLIYDYISKDSYKQDIIVNAVKNKGYEPLLDDYLNRPRTRSYKWTLSGEPDNWNVVCNGGGIMAAVSFADELPEYSEQIFEYAFPLLEKASKCFSPDGAWYEGVDYWHYTIIYYVGVLCALNTSAGCDYGFSDVNGLERTGYFPFAMHGEGGRFNFSDCGAGILYTPEIFYLANLFDDKKLEKLQLDFISKLNRCLDARSILWYKSSTDIQSYDIPLDYYFRDTEVCSMRSSYEKNANYIGFRAGKNNVYHAHLDIGSFVLDMGGQRFACDLGSENYALETTNKWELYRKRAEGHNTITINPDGNPDQNDEACVVMNRFETSEDSSLVVCDMTSAYCDDVKSAIRGIRFLNNRQTVLIQDEISCISTSDIWWFMHTQADITISEDGKTAELSKNGVTIYAKLLTSQGTFQVMDAKPLAASLQNSSQNANSSYKKLAIYFEDVIDLDIAVEFLPQNLNVNSAEILPISEWK